MLPNGMDIAVLVIIGIFAVLGWRKGLVKMGFRLISLVLSLGCAWAFHPYLSELLKKTPLYESLFSSAVEQTEPAADLPGMLLGVGNAIGNRVAEYLTDLLLNGISFLLIFLLARVVIFLLSKVLHFVATLPLLGFVNRLTGVAIGFAEGLLVVWILFAMLVTVPAFRENKDLGYSIEQSIVARSLYQNNPILNAFLPEEDAKESNGKETEMTDGKELEE